MAQNPLATAANEVMSASAPQVFHLLSELGQELFFPKGILTQSAEAGKLATRYNATIGIATENGHAMHLDCVQKQFADDLNADDLYPYAPSTGLPALRAAWQAKQVAETPSLAGQATSLPVVTNALTHGLALVGELFINRGDEVLLPDQLWGNYRLTWGTRQGARLSTFPFFTDDLQGFNQAAFAAAIAERHGQKIIVVLNFPNNPTGYSLTTAEQAAVVVTLTDAAAAGTKIVAVCDDAYYGMFFDDTCATESIFGPLSQAHPNLLAIKVDGATKEQFVWGLRVGFITYGFQGGTDDVYKALEQKTGGAIRGAVSNVTRPGQTIVLRALQNPAFGAQRAAKVALLQGRAAATAQAARDPAYQDLWDVYPFNAGYFMCIRLKNVDAEMLRVHLLQEHGLGVIALGKTDIRVAFSCLDEEQIADVFARIAQGIQALSAA
jgi:aspartate/methionine/tyrosine aminotransferase